MKDITVTDDGHWHFDRSINLPSLFAVVAVAIGAIYGYSQLNFQVAQNTADLASYKAAFAALVQARQESIRSYEQRMTTQENFVAEVRRWMVTVDGRLERIEDGLRGDHTSRP